MTFFSFKFIDSIFILVSSSSGGWSPGSYKFVHRSWQWITYSIEVIWTFSTTNWFMLKKISLMFLTTSTGNQDLKKNWKTLIYILNFAVQYNLLNEVKGNKHK